MMQNPRNGFKYRNGQKILIKETNILISDLPEDTSWSDLMYKIYVRQKIENGLKDVDEARMLSTEEVKQAVLSTFPV